MKIWLIQSSLNPQSKTAILIDMCKEYCEKQWIEIDLIDLREYDIPHCNWWSKESYKSDDVNLLWDKVDACTHFIFWMPVYQYTFSWVLKNFLDIFGEPLKHKAFWIAEMSGSIRAYLSPAALIDSLFFECTAIPVPPVVHAWAGDFTEGEMTNEYISQKIEELVKNLQRVS